jgi:K+-sensing histidine kinase KdpD
VTSTILDNAIKFSPFGGSIELTSTRRGDNIILTVNNTGSTFGSAEIAAKIFEPFNHSTDAADLTSEGLGISLYLDKLIMQHIGGTISAKDTALKHSASVGIVFPSIK